MVLLDTSGYSAFRRGDANLAETLRMCTGIYVNPIILGELRQGFRQGSRREKNETQLNDFLRLSRVHILDITPDTADCYASIVTSLRKAGTPIPTNDCWIAASAMQYSLRVLTTDPHFQQVNQITVLLFPVHPN